MKKYLFNCFAIIMVAALSFSFASCSSDDDNDEVTISKAELIGTWYTLEDRWVFSLAESTVTLYELWQSSGRYLLNPVYSVTKKYTISGNRIVSEDNHTAIVTPVNDNTISINIDNETLTLTKFNGTPQQLISYLNK